MSFWSAHDQLACLICLVRQFLIVLSAEISRRERPGLGIGLQVIIAIAWLRHEARDQLSIKTVIHVDLVEKLSDLSLSSEQVIWV